jgi:hypothetical protein
MNSRLSAIISGYVFRLISPKAHFIRLPSKFLSFKNSRFWLGVQAVDFELLLLKIEGKFDGALP